MFTTANVLLCNLALSQGLLVHALEEGTDKPLHNIPVTLRYGCVPVGSGLNLKWKGCKWITRRTDKEGIAHFDEAATLPDIDDVYSLPITYGATCCDIQPKTFPSEGTIHFRKRTLSEQLH